MNNNKNNRLLPIILCVAFAIIARITGIVYSYFATDVMYANSVICQILPALRQLFTALSYACIAGGAMSCVLAKVSVKTTVLVYTAVAFAENVAVIFIDVLSGVFAGDPMRLFMGIVYRLGLTAYSVLMLLLGVAIGKAIITRGGNTAVAVAVASVLPVAVDFFAVLCKSIASLIEWEFMPYTNEIYTIFFELGTVVLMGILSAIAALILTGKNTTSK